MDLNESRVSRRSLTAGVAWAAPAVVLAGAAPAMAASFELKYNAYTHIWRVRQSGSGSTCDGHLYAWGGTGDPLYDGVTKTGFYITAPNGRTGSSTVTNLTYSLKICGLPAPLSFTTTGASISAGWKYVSTTNNGGNGYTYKFTYTTPTTLAWNTGSIDIKLVSALWSHSGISLCSYNTAGVTAVGDWSATIDGKAWSTAKTPLNI